MSPSEPTVAIRAVGVTRAKIEPKIGHPKSAFRGLRLMWLKNTVFIFIKFPDYAINTKNQLEAL